MKRAYKLMVLGSVMMFCFFFFFQGEVRAASPDFYKRYSVKGYEEEYTFKLKVMDMMIMMTGTMIMMTGMMIGMMIG